MPGSLKNIFGMYDVDTDLLLHTIGTKSRIAMVLASSYMIVLMI